MNKKLILQLLIISTFLEQNLIQADSTTVSGSSSKSGSGSNNTGSGYKLSAIFDNESNVPLNIAHKTDTEIKALVTLSKNGLNNKPYTVDSVLIQKAVDSKTGNPITTIDTNQPYLTLTKIKPLKTPMIDPTGKAVIDDKGKPKYNYTAQIEVSETDKNKKTTTLSTLSYSHGINSTKSGDTKDAKKTTCPILTIQSNTSSSSISGLTVSLANGTGLPKPSTDAAAHSGSHHRSKTLGKLGKASIKKHKKSYNK